MPLSVADRFRRVVDQDVLRSLEASTVDVADAKYFPPFVYTSEEWFGYEHFDHDAPPLSPTLRKLEDEMRNYDVEHMVDLPPIDVPDYPWNWKVMLENFMEPYHNAYLHKGIHDFALGHGFVDHSAEEN